MQAPINIYDKAKWTTSATYSGSSIGNNPYGIHNLNFSVDALTYLTNGNAKASSTAIGNNIDFVRGDYVMLGDFLLSCCSEKASTMTGPASVTKLGDWTVTYYFRLGMTKNQSIAFTNKTGRLVLNTTGSNIAIAQASGSSASLVNESGATADFKRDVYIGNFGTGFLVVNGGEAAVDPGCIVTLGSHETGAGHIELNGGVLSAKRIGRDYGAGTLLFNGGTLKANGVDSDGIVQRHESLKVYAGANGGTIDTGGLDVVWSADVAAADGVAQAGGLKIAGGGTLTVKSAATFSSGGRTAVEAGTRLLVEAGAGVGSLGVSVADGTQPGVYNIAAMSGDGAFPADVVDGAAVPEDSELKLSENGKAVVFVYKRSLIPSGVWIGSKSNDLCDGENWSGGTVPNGAAAKISVAEARTLVAGGAFAPSSIEFAADSAAVAIDGNISGIDAIVNNSGTTHVFGGKVVFSGAIDVTLAKADPGVASLAARGGFVDFAGGVAGTGIENHAIFCGDYTVTDGNYVFSATARKTIYENSSLSVPASGDTPELYIMSGGRFVTQKAESPRNPVCWNFGEYVVAGDFLLKPASGEEAFLAHQKDGVYRFETLTIDDRGSSSSAALTFFFANAAGSRQDPSNKTLYIGAGGMNIAEGCKAATRFFAGNYGTAVNSYTVNIYPWHSDFAIGTKTGATSDFVTKNKTVFWTTDESGTARTVTCNGIVGSSGAIGTVIRGAGTFVVNAANTTVAPWYVEDTATLAVNPGCRPTTAALVVEAGATLSLPRTGATAACGAVKVNAGAGIRFLVSGDSNSVLAVGSLEAGGSGVATVQVDFAKGSALAKSSYTLTSGAKLDPSADVDAMFALDDGGKGGFLSISAEGELVYNTPPGFIIRVAETGTVKIPVEWVAKHVSADCADAERTCGNGLPVWQNWCLGLTPEDATSVVICEAAAVQPGDGTVAIAAKNLNVRENSGAAVTAYLDRSADADNWSNVASKDVASGAVSFAASLAGVESRCFFRIRVAVR